MTRGDVSTLKHDQASLEFLRLLQAHWDNQTTFVGDPYNTTLCRLVMIGWMEGRPSNISSLAAGLHTSRQQATRRVLAMAKLGWVEYQRRRTQVVVLPSSRLIELSQAELPKRMAIVGAKWRKIMGLSATVGAALAAASEASGGPPQELVEVASQVAQQVVAIAGLQGGLGPIPIRGTMP